MDKYCKYCKTIKSACGFKRQNSIKCLDCEKDYRKARYDVSKNFVIEYKKNNPCNNCGINDYRVLDLHHLYNKKFTVAHGVKNRLSVEALSKEIDKCITLCANCHRIWHYKERNNQINS